MAENEDAVPVAPEPQPATAAFAFVPDHALIRLIGRGSSGEVWLARNTLGTYRAVKIVYERTFRHRRPFEREFKGVQKFEPISRMHEGLIDVLQVGINEEAGYFYCVMELADDVVSGQAIHPDNYTPRTLAQEMAVHKRLSLAECLRIGAAIASALDFLHVRGLIHRDVKPSNIVFVNGIPELADIGLVVEVSEAKSYVGTEGFIPPEGPGTERADIYSLGKVLYEIITGKDRHDYPELPTQLGGAAPDAGLLELNKIILKACRTDPRERYKSAGCMADDLRALQRGERVRPNRMAGRGVRGISVAMAVAAGLTVVAWLLTLVFPQSRPVAALRSLFESGSLQDRIATHSAVAVAPGVLGWWQAEQNTFDFLGRNNGNLMNGAGFGPGKVGHAFKFDGVNQYLQIPDSPLLNPTNGLTLESWVCVTDYPKQFAMIIGKDKRYAEQQYLLWIGPDPTGQKRVFYSTIKTTDGSCYALGKGAVELNRWQHLAMTYDNAVLKLYIDGELAVETPRNRPMLATSHPLFVGGNPQGDCLNGSVDEPGLYDRALSAGEIKAIYEAGSSGKRLLPPRITSQPQNAVVLKGENAVFTVEMESSTAVSCEWHQNLIILPGATNASLTVSNVQPNASGLFSVVISNPGGSVTSSNAVLQVISPVSFTECVACTNFDSSGNLGFAEGTTRFGAALRLVSRESNAAGAVWLADKQYCAGGFSSSFRFRAEKLESPAPDSDESEICLALGPAGCLTSPGQTGFPANSLKVALGVRDETGAKTAGGFLDIRSGGWRGYRCDLNGARTSLSDGGEHAVAVQCHGSYLSVSVDGQLLVTNLPIPLDAALDPGGYATVAVCARRGGTWRACDLLDWTFCFTAPPQPIPVPSGLVGWWRAEGDALDSVGGRGGVMHNVAFVPGRVHQAFSFNGVNGYIEVPDSPALRLTNELTIEFWVKRLRLDESVELCMGKGLDWSSGQRNYGIALGRESNRYFFEFQYAGGVQGGGSIADTNWHHCAVATTNGQRMPNLYIDGVEQEMVYGLDNTNILLYPSTLPLQIGAQVNANWPYYGKVLLDELSIYNRALAPREIKAIHAAGGAGKVFPTNPAAAR